jgi:hypothetical protein
MYMDILRSVQAYWTLGICPIPSYIPESNRHGRLQLPTEIIAEGVECSAHPFSLVNFQRGMVVDDWSATSENRQISRLIASKSSLIFSGTNMEIAVDPPESGIRWLSFTSEVGRSMGLAR